MINIILSGCMGRMGKVVTELANEDSAVRIAAGIDVISPEDSAFPVFPDFDTCTVDGDVIIDFSSPAVFDSMLDYAVRTGTPAVVCTTGLSEEQIGRIDEAARKTAILRSANMSLGINLLMKLLRDAAPVLSEAGFDIEIVEQHHGMKKDAPSGTAIALADSINDACGNRYQYVYDRSTAYEQRGKDQLGISSVRGGTIVGIHDAIFAGTDEVLELRHTAYSRAIFAKGALTAAKFLTGKEPGFYEMSDVIESSVGNGERETE